MKSDNITLYVSIAILIFLLILIFTKSMSSSTCNSEPFAASSNVSTLTNQNINDANKVDLLKCSHSCCLSNTWPYPFNVTDPNISDDELKNYIPSNMSCNRGGSGGCVCFTQDNFNYLAEHGKGISPPVANYGYTYAPNN